jgi:hypothetical protein
MSSRRISNLQLREAILQRFINEVERKFFEITSDSLLRKRKQQDMKLFIQLIDPDSDNILKTTSFEKLIRRISRSTSYLFTQNDSSMLNLLLTYTFLTRPSILDNPIFMPRTEYFSRPASSFLPQNNSISPTQRSRPRSPSIRGPRREQSNEEITPGVWIRGSSFPIYTTQTPTQISTQTPIPQTPAAPTMSLMPQIPSIPDVSPIPQTPVAPIITQSSQPTQNVPWGYEDTSTTIPSIPPIPQTPAAPIITQSSQPTQNVPWGYEDTSTTISSISDFEEDKLPDTKIKTDKNSLIINDTNSDLITCDSENNDSDPNVTTLSKDNKQWVETNCYSCLNPVTQYNYTQEEWSDLISIKQLDSNGKFKRGHCISINDFKESIKRDLINSTEELTRMNYKTIFSIYKLKNKNLPEKDLRRGLGTRPTKMLLFLLNLPSGTLFIDIESAYKLVHNKTKELYALPLFGGLRRRVGNLKGSLMEISTHHGQIDGYKIYRLLTRSEIEDEINVDFELQLLNELQHLLQFAYKDDEINTIMISNITNNIIKILTGEQSSF